jgi:purine-cytosine permease-like protein
MPQLDPNVPPHKTAAFWYIVALGVLMGVGYRLVAGTHGSFLLDIVPSIVTFAMLVCIGWFAVRRAQRGESYFTSRRITVRVALLIFAIICFILAQIFKNHR